MKCGKPSVRIRVSRVQTNSETYRRALELIGPILPYRYAQWLIEDPENHDYRVIASVIPHGTVGYDIAHRTGVIGQVFRLRTLIAVPDVRNHPLYDPFETTIDWELCFPVQRDANEFAVVNLEGIGPLDLNGAAWDRVCEIIEQTTSYKPESIGEDTSHLIQTHRIRMLSDKTGDYRSALVAAARAIARGGQSTLLAGDFEDLLTGRGPTMADALTQDLDASYCFFGAEQNLDILATGPNPQNTLSTNALNWWDRAQGRYAFVLLSCD